MKRGDTFTHEGREWRVVVITAPGNLRHDPEPEVLIRPDDGNAWEDRWLRRSEVEKMLDPEQGVLPMFGPVAHIPAILRETTEERVLRWMNEDVEEARLQRRAQVYAAAALSTLMPERDLDADSIDPTFVRKMRQKLRLITTDEAGL